MDMKLNNKSIVVLAACAAGSVAFVACDNDKIYDMNHEAATVISSITFEYENEITLPVGESLPLNTVILPEEAAYAGILYRTSDEGIAFIDDNGVLHCVSEGVAYVSAVPSIGFGATASLTVNVVDHVVYAESLTIAGVEELAQYHYLGDQFQLKAVIMPEDHTYDFVNWTTSDPTVIDIDADGNVTCGVPGTATVTATTRYPDKAGISGSMQLTVSESADVESVEIKPVLHDICVDVPFDLDVVYYPDYGNHATVEWESSDESVAFVNRGHVTPTGYGTCTLTATTPTGNTASINITVVSGWRIWDMSNRYGLWLLSSGSAFDLTSVPNAAKVVMPNNSGKYRADIKFACDANSPLVLNFGEYPVIALRTTIPPDGRNTFDVVDVNGTGGGNPQCNVGQYGTGNPITLSDGSVLIYVDWSKRSQYPLTTDVRFKTFQVKIADIPAEAGTPDSYLIYWIRTFRSVEEMQAFAEAELAAGN